MARVYVSSVINGRSDRVWARVRDFNGLPAWHPGIAESRIENGEPPDKIGCVRDFRLRNGDRIREKLLGLSDFDQFQQSGWVGHQTYCTAGGLAAGAFVRSKPDRRPSEWPSGTLCRISGLQFEANMGAPRVAAASNSAKPTKWRLKTTFWLDVALLIAVCALQTVRFTGLVIHEWLGLAIVGMILATCRFPGAG